MCIVRLPCDSRRARSSCSSSPRTLSRPSAIGFTSCSIARWRLSSSSRPDTWCWPSSALASWRKDSLESRSALADSDSNIAAVSRRAPSAFFTCARMTSPHDESAERCTQDEEERFHGGLIDGRRARGQELPESGGLVQVRRSPSGIAAAALATASAGSLGLWYQLFSRPLPKTRGRLRLRGLEAPVEVSRDRFGVPHIEARTDADLCFALGFCHGQDRLWQLEFFRRAPPGRLSEFAGADALQVDRLMRTLGPAPRRRARGARLIRARRAERAWRPTRAGVNAAIEAAPALPIEFQLLRIEPEPWTLDGPARDRASCWRSGSRPTGRRELCRAQLVRDAGAEKAARLEPQYPRGQPGDRATRACPTSGDGARPRRADRRGARGARPGRCQPAGSNNWVVSGERSATGSRCSPATRT